MHVLLFLIIKDYTIVRDGKQEKGWGFVQVNRKNCADGNCIWLGKEYTWIQRYGKEVSFRVHVVFYL